MNLWHGHANLRASTAVVGALAPARRDLPQNRLRQLGSILVTTTLRVRKSKAHPRTKREDGAPKLQHPNLNIQTSKPKTPTPELQDPEFAIKRKAVSSYRMPRTGALWIVSTFRLILMSTPLVFG